VLINVVQVRNNLLQMSSTESELSSLKVRFFGGFVAGNFSLCGTDLIAEGKSGYFIECLDLEVIPVMFVKKLTIK
jgi:hypothetical protein